MIRTKAFKLRTVNNINFLVAIRRNKYGFSMFHLNQVGVYIWNILESDKKLENVICETIKEFPEVTKKEIINFITKLISMELIKENQVDLYIS